MKAMIFVTGVGYGDAVREECIIREILRRDKDNEVLIAGYDNSFEYFKGRYDVVSIKSYKFPDNSFELKFFDFIKCNILFYLFWIYDFFKLLFVMKRFDPDVVISDFEPIGAFMARFLKKKLVLVFGADPRVIGDVEKDTKFMEMQANYVKRMYRYKGYVSKVFIPSLNGELGEDELFSFTKLIVRKRLNELPSEAVLWKPFWF